MKWSSHYKSQGKHFLNKTILKTWALAATPEQLDTMASIPQHCFSKQPSRTARYINYNFFNKSITWKPSWLQRKSINPKSFGMKLKTSTSWYVYSQPTDRNICHLLKSHLHNPLHRYIQCHTTILPPFPLTWLNVFCTSKEPSYRSSSDLEPVLAQQTGLSAHCNNC